MPSKTAQILRGPSPKEKAALTNIKAAFGQYMWIVYWLLGNWLLGWTLYDFV